MKIGLLTLPIRENYGGILQCVALYSYLKQQGHDVVLLYKDSETAAWKDLIKKLLFLVPFHDFKGIKSSYRIKRLHLPFIKNCIPDISSTLKTSEDLANAVKNYQLDAVVVGSDQVWRLSYIKGNYYKSYFLDFVDYGVKKIAYAASFGKDYWEGKGDEADIGELLERFDFISVREESGIDICKNTFGVQKDIHHVLDPTMLQAKEFYLSLMPSNSFNKKISILTYVLDEAAEKNKIISACMTKRGVTAEDVLNLKGFGDKNKYYSVPEWLEAFSKADFIITDSFHGVVFSIIFNKQFIAIANKDRGLDRFLSLLNIFGLQDRLVFENHFDLSCLESYINYEEVNIKLDEQRKKSAGLLFSINAQ